YALSCARSDAHPDLHSFPTRRSSDLPNPDIVRRPLKLYESDQVAHQPIPHLRSYLKRSHSLRQVRVKMIAASRVDTIYRLGLVRDRKSTRLNSSHVAISYAVFCLKKK